MSSRFQRLKTDSSGTLNEKFHFKLALGKELKVTQPEAEEEGDYTPQLDTQKLNFVYKSPKAIRLPKISNRPKLKQVMELKDNGLIVRYNRSKKNLFEAKMNFGKNPNTQSMKQMRPHLNARRLFRIKNTSFNRSECLQRYNVLQFVGCIFEWFPPSFSRLIFYCI